MLLFNSIWAKLIGVFLINVLFTGVWIALFKKKNIFQSIYAHSPTNHQQKSRTVTMGGAGIALSLCIGVLFLPLSKPLLWVFLLFLCFTCIGFLDDILSLLNQQNKGLSARQKFTLQVLTSAMLLLLYSYFITPLSLIQLVFYSFILVGASNATNITDGLDGLLGGLSVCTLLGFYWAFLSTPHTNLATLCLMGIASLLAFLMYNKKPARIFMGDTGSLGLGALFAGLAIVYGNVWILLPFGMVFIIETLSVMIQVLSFRTRQKRIFLMSPLHHHFELLGLSEWQIVLLFWAIGGLGVLLHFLPL